MKKFAAIISIVFLFLITPVGTVFAQPAPAAKKGIDIFIQKTGDQGVDPNADVGRVIGNGITILFAAAVIAVLFMLIIGGFNWITSGGDKEAVGKARARIINALIGLVILAVAFLLANIAGQIVNIDLFNLHLPSLDEGAAPSPTPAIRR